MTGEEIDYSALTSYGDGDESTGYVGSVRVYSGQGFYVTIRLSDIFGSRITESENPETGEPERGLFIPFKNSGVTVTPKKNVIATYDMSMAQVPSMKYTHLLRQIMDRMVEDHWRKLGFHHNYDGFAAPKGYRKKNKKM